MTESSLPTIISGAKSTFNILKEWRELKDNEKRQTETNTKTDDLLEIKRQNAQDRGRDIARAGDSGIVLSSFNDVLLSEDLKAAREIYDKQQKAREETLALRKQAKKERRNKRDKAFVYSVGLLSDFAGSGN